jgi:hypothetical protein
MIEGHTLGLDPHAKELLAGWVAKVQILFQYAGTPPRAVSPCRLECMYQHQRPAAGTFIWLAAYNGKWGVWARSHHLRLVRPSRPSEVMDSELFTICVGQLVFQLLVGPDSVQDSFRPEIPSEVLPWLLPLWPDTGPVIWPPRLTLDDTGLERYSSSFINA